MHCTHCKEITMEPVELEKGLIKQYLITLRE